MRAVVIDRPGGPESLRVAVVPVPSPGPGEVRVRVAAAAVNPVDVMTRSGVFYRVGWIRRRTVGLGWDVAGVVDEVGPGVGDMTPGTLVAGLRDALDAPLGTYADYVILPADAVAPVPDGIDPVAASTMPLNALTADQALDLVDPSRGDSLLVTGAAGGVGGYVVPLALERGWRVTALARERDREWLLALGASRVVHHLDGEKHQYDAAIDAADLVVPTMAAVRDGGDFVGVQPAFVPAAERGVRVQAVAVRRDAARLGKLLALAVEGHLPLRVAGTLPLAQAAEAHRRLEAGGSRGRWVLVP